MTLSFNNDQKMKDMEKLNKARDTIVQSIAENMDLYGITESIGRLYGTLYFSNHPLTLDEMREALGMSKTSMSNGVRTLLETKLVRKVWKKGERKDLYNTENDWYKSFFDYFLTKWVDAIEANLKAIKEYQQDIMKLYNNEDTNTEVKEEIKMDLEKIEDMQAYYQWLQQLIDTFETGKIFDLVPKPKKM